MNNAQEELLIILMEECAEVAQECSKVLRFGNDHDKLEKELGDLQCIIDMMHHRDMVSYNNIFDAADAKYHKLKDFSTHLFPNPNEE